MTDRVKEIARKTLMTVIAVAMAAGAIAVLRVVSRYLAGVWEPEGGKRALRFEVSEEGANAPRVYDLKGMICEDLRYTVVGIDAERKTERVQFPLETAVRSGNLLARSEGWEEAEIPRIGPVSYEPGDDYYFKRKDGSILVKRYLRKGKGETEVVSIELPEALAMDAECDEDMVRTVSVKGRRLLLMIPEPIRSVTVGTPAFTGFVQRHAGATFIMNCVSPLGLAEARGRFREAAAKGGWKAFAEGTPCYICENLTLTVDFAEAGGAGAGTVVNYRISDDEVHIKKERSENEN